MKRTAFHVTICLCLGLLLSTCTKNDRQQATTPPLQATAASTTLAANAATLTTPFTTAYVEVNSNSFHNPGCFTYGSPAKQVFSFAVIFAANINDSSNGQAELYFNPQVQSTLNSGNVAYLQSLGIKVLLDVLGNHENAGWGCFTSYAQADSFAIQCENAVTKYGLDGIDIDDEYSVCTTNTSSLVLCVSALRARLGTTKYITKALFDDIQYFSATYNGKTAGQILDYGWEETYGNTNYSGRLQPYVSAGMAKTKLSIGVDIGGTDETTAAKFVKSNGYAGVMTYNISTTSKTNLSKVTTTLFNSATNVTANCLQ
jgi:Glycosyl hydrolases family 18